MWSAIVRVTPRDLFVQHVPAGVTYEELFDAVGVFGILESVKLVPEKKQAFINFVEPQAAYHIWQLTYHAWQLAYMRALYGPWQPPACIPYMAGGLPADGCH